jgi:hypothetical protein
MPPFGLKNGVAKDIVATRLSGETAVNRRD